MLKKLGEQKKQRITKLGVTIAILGLVALLTAF